MYTSGEVGAMHVEQVAVPLVHHDLFQALIASDGE
jgi:hypothetical protein